MATVWKTTYRGNRVGESKTWRCPDCGGMFPHFHVPPDAPPPDQCPLCDAWMASDEPPIVAFVPRSPRIRKSLKVKAVDQTYRAMEEQSIQRADAAVVQLESAYDEAARADPQEGDPRFLDDMKRSQIADMRSTLKMTNMKDPESLREGDISHIPQGRVMQSSALPGANFGMMPQVPGYTGGGSAPELGAVMTGIRANHSTTARQVVAAGNLGIAKK